MAEAVKSASKALTKTEAIAFLHDILEMTSIHEKLTTNKAAFLDEVIDRFQQRMPFQSISTISRSSEEQHLSTMEDIKAQMFSSHGGLCYDLNLFMNGLLVALDFEVSLIACDIGLNGIHDHVVLLVKNLIKYGDQWHVDVGVGDPIFRAILFDFEQESQVYTTGFLTHKFVKQDDVFTWFHKTDTYYQPVTRAIDGWRKYMTFTLEPRNIEYFRNPMRRHFVTQNQDPPLPGISFLDSLRAVVFPNQKLVAINGTSFLKEDETGKITKTKISSKDELLSLYAKCFPQFPADMVQNVVEKMNYTF